MPLTIPEEDLEQPVSAGGDDFTFPPGSYEGVIEDVSVRNLPAWADNAQELEQRVRVSNNGWETADLEILSIQIGRIEPLDTEEDVDPGDRKFFVPENPNSPGLTVRDGHHTIDNIDPSEDDVEYYKLQWGADYVARLAAALGQVNRSNGNVSVRDGFLEDLKAGKFNDQRVGFDVDHAGTYERSDGTEVTEQRITQFFAV